MVLYHNQPVKQDLSAGSLGVTAAANSSSINGLTISGSTVVGKSGLTITARGSGTPLLITDLSMSDSSITGTTYDAIWIGADKNYPASISTSNVRVVESVITGSGNGLGMSVSDPGTTLAVP